MAEREGTEGGTLACALRPRMDAERVVHLSFQVTNAGPTATTLAYADPFLDFEIAAEAGGRERRIRAPDLDIPARPVERRLAPSDTVTVETPVVLRAGDAAPAEPDPFAWWMEGDPAGVYLRAVVRFAGTALETDRVAWPGSSSAGAMETERVEP